MLRRPVKGIVLTKPHVMVFMATGPNGQRVTSLVFIKINNRFELASAIAMTLSQIPVKSLG